jgi:hypothetical protein
VWQGGLSAAGTEIPALYVDLRLHQGPTSRTRPRKHSRPPGQPGVQAANPSSRKRDLRPASARHCLPPRMSRQEISRATRANRFGQSTSCDVNRGRWAESQCVCATKIARRTTGYRQASVSLRSREKQGELQSHEGERVSKKTLKKWQRLGKVGKLVQILFGRQAEPCGNATQTPVDHCGCVVQGLGSKSWLGSFVCLLHYCLMDFHLVRVPWFDGVGKRRCAHALLA